MVLYAGNRRDVREYHFFDRTLSLMTAPLQYGIMEGFEAVYGVWERYIYLVDVQQRERQLLQEVHALRRQVLEQEELSQDNKRLRALLHLNVDDGEDRVTVAARVIATSTNPFFRSVRINRGSQHGLEIGQAVVNEDGAVGRIAALGLYTAEVMLLVDNNSSVDVLVQRTRAHARMRGEGRDSEMGLKLQYLPRSAKVEPGDVLLTSGVGQVFPKGYAVGRVREVERVGYGLYQHVIVEPVVDFSRIETVLVVQWWWPQSAKESNPLKPIS